MEVIDLHKMSQEQGTLIRWATVYRGRCGHQTECGWDWGVLWRCVLSWCSISWLARTKQFSPLCRRKTGSHGNMSFYKIMNSIIKICDCLHKTNDNVLCIKKNSITNSSSTKTRNIQRKILFCTCVKCDIVQNHLKIDHDKLKNILENIKQSSK